jgi:hypothetical protein
MEKLIILAGPSNSGKTISVNLTIKKLVEIGCKVVSYPLNDHPPEFWKILDENGNPTTSGAVILKNGEKLIALISFGDNVYRIKKALSTKFITDCQTKITTTDCQTVICCSRAAKGRSVFEYFHDYIQKNIDLSKTDVIPIYKNLLRHYENMAAENDYTAELINKIIKL